MATLKATRIKEALAKVQKVGRIEEAFTVSGCELVLQNLSPTDFEQALQAIEGLEDVAYAYAFQLEQVSRGLVEINGQDLRDVDFIEDEVPVGTYVLEVVLPNKALAESVAAKLREQKLTATITQQEGGGTKTVKLERHRWLQENILKGWGREALAVAWRKFTEVLVKADEEAKKGVTFLVPDETAEEKYRRLMNELRETEDELPDELINRVLDENGLMKKALRQELDAANERLTRLDQRVENPVQEAEAPPIVTPPPSVPQGRGPVPQEAPPEAVQRAMEAMPRLNEHNVNIPTPPRSGDRPTVSATPRPQVPDQIRRAAFQNTQGMQRQAPQPQPQPQPQQGPGIHTRRPGRAGEIAAEMAAMEALDPAMAAEATGATGQPAMVPHQQQNVPELSGQEKGVDPGQFKANLDRPPMAGINRKFVKRGV